MNNFFDKNERPLEAEGAVRVYLTEHLAMTLGGGRGILAGIGNPLYRVVAELSYVPKARDYRQQSALIHTQEKYSEVMLGLRDNCPAHSEEFNPDIHDVKCPQYYELNETAGLLTNCPENPEDYDPDIHEVNCEKAYTLLEGYSNRDRFAVFALKKDDRDWDGIPDSMDQCPEESEDLNGIADTDGCPEGGVQVTGDQIWTSSPVHFGFGRSDISKQAAETLCHLAGALYFHRDIKHLYVIGYADSLGPRRANKRLSKKRARAVIRYITQCGVPEDIELTPMGEGEAHPVATNKTREGRQKNRRVIFSRVPQGPVSQPQKSLYP